MDKGRNPTRNTESARMAELDSLRHLRAIGSNYGFEPFADSRSVAHEPKRAGKQRRSIDR